VTAELLVTILSLSCTVNENPQLQKKKDRKPGATGGRLKSRGIVKDQKTCAVSLLLRTKSNGGCELNLSILEAAYSDQHRTRLLLHNHSTT
jgi:hypothetical protein